MRNGVVEMYGGLLWRKNLHGSMGLSLFDEENEEDGRRWKLEVGVREEKRKRLRV